MLLRFFSGLSGDDTDRYYVLTTSLPFCRGRAIEKLDILWQSLESTCKNYICYDELLQLLHVLIILPAKLIPELAQSADNANQDLKKLIECSEEQIKAYAKSFMPKEPREGNRMHRHEFDLWANEINVKNLFSPLYHRQSLLKFLSPCQPVEQNIN